MIQLRTLGFSVGAFAIVALSACTTHGQGGNNMTKAQELQDYHWTQVNIINSQGTSEPAFRSANGGPLVMNFNDGQLLLSGLCNNMVAGYSLEGSTLTVSNPAATMKMCIDNDLMRYEQQVGQELGTLKSWSIASTEMTDAAPILTLQFADGKKWRLKGEQTSQAKYGVEPVRVFLEVAANKVACEPTGQAQQQCLYVREITYNDQGIKTGTGQWLNYYATIKGYEHQPNVRQVIRVNRYPLANAPADSMNFADELDMIVESEAIN